MKDNEYEFYLNLNNEKKYLCDALRKTLKAVVSWNVKMAMLINDTKKLREYKKDSRLDLYKNNFNFVSCSIKSAVNLYETHPEWLNDSYNKNYSNYYWFIKDLPEKIKYLDDDIEDTKRRIQLNNKIIKQININNKVINAVVYNQDSVCIELKVQTDSLNDCIKDLGNPVMIRTGIDYFDKPIKSNEAKYIKQLSRKIKPKKGYYKVIIDDYFADEKDSNPDHFFTLYNNNFRVKVIEPTNGNLVDDILMNL